MKTKLYLWISTSTTISMLYHPGYFPLFFTGASALRQFESLHVSCNRILR